MWNGFYCLLEWLEYVTGIINSSFYKYVARGIYPAEWGEGKKIDIPGSEFDI